MFFSIIYLILFFITVVISYFFIKLCCCLSWKYNLLDKPLKEKHKCHIDPTPILGGLGMLLAILFVGIIGLLIIFNFENVFFLNIKKGIINQWSEFIILIGGALGIFLIGFYDDFRPLKARYKLTMQLILMGIVAKNCFQISCFIDNSFISWLLTLAWLVFIINSINFFDNMDGLSSGITVISALAFMIIAIIKGQYFVIILSLLTSAVALGFFIQNKFPAKIFMGNAGSYFLGYLLATLGGMTTYYSEENMSYLPIIAPLLILALSIFDTFIVFLIRKFNGKSFFVGDNNHISHRFVKMGFSKKDSVSLIHFFQIILSICAIGSITANLLTSIIISFLVVVILFFIIYLQTRSIKKI